MEVVNDTARGFGCLGILVVLILLINEGINYYNENSNEEFWKEEYDEAYEKLVDCSVKDSGKNVGKGVGFSVTYYTDEECDEFQSILDKYSMKLYDELPHTDYKGNVREEKK
ncbi:MAG: hypothetical protein K0R18_579 [Bacillales bacterium]|jgi:hypothetical protein|nr:hypothetical protein [Bacillales bacterium]